MDAINNIPDKKSRENKTFTEMSSEINDIWTKSKHTKPDTVLIPWGNIYFIVIKKEGSLYRCINEHNQIVLVSIQNNSTNKEDDLYLVECIPSDLDIFVKEKIAPGVYHSK